MVRLIFLDNVATPSLGMQMVMTITNRKPIDCILGVGDDFLAKLTSVDTLPINHRVHISL